MKITGPPATSRSQTRTPTSTPLPSPTPLPEFSMPPPGNSFGEPSKQNGEHQGDRPLYVKGSAADRHAKLSRMSSPLRRGTHESWWAREMGWFNAVSKVRVAEG